MSNLPQTNRLFTGLDQTPGKILLPGFGAQVRGQVGKQRIFSHNQGGLYLKRYGVPAVPTSPGQLAVVERFRQAMVAWRDLDENEKRRWKTFVVRSGLEMQTHSFFVKLHMKGRVEPLRSRVINRLDPYVE